MPTDSLRRELSREGAVDKVSVVADFVGALRRRRRSEGVPVRGAARRRNRGICIPPHAGQLLGKKSPSFKFLDLAGRPVTLESLAGKTVVLDFCSSGYDVCRENLKQLEQTYQKYKDNPKLAFYAVCLDPPEVKNEDLKKTFEEMKIHIPVVRDADGAAAAFRTEEPKTFLLDARGIVQDCAIDGDPKLAETLPAKL